jgi:hypothetical protein
MRCLLLLLRLLAPALAAVAPGAPARAQSDEAAPLTVQSDDAAPARAEAEEAAPTAPTNLIVYGDLRLAAADGERSWLDGGFGKGRYGNGNGDSLRVRPHLAEAGVVWQPHLSWALTGTIAAVYQEGQQHPIDLSEAFLAVRPLPLDGTRISIRAGLFWPPVSLEHSGPEWAVTNSITPSAINSWIGEEVKLAGVEFNATRMLGSHRLTLTLATFGGNETSGTLLTFRGWALHDEKATAFGLQPLPRLNGFMTGAQGARTRPLVEIDDKIGFYVKLGWAPPGPFEIQYFHYDNLGDPQELGGNKQWGWRTRFDHLGAILDLGPSTRLIGQALTGTTLMGYPRGGPQRWVNTRYRSAFLMATRTIGPGTLSARIETFDTRNHGSVVLAEDDETGWSANAAIRWPLASFATLLGEALHIDSRRRSRLRDAVAPRQRQTILQLSLRLRAAR